MYTVDYISQQSFYVSYTAYCFYGMKNNTCIVKIDFGFIAETRARVFAHRTRFMI